MAAASPTIGPYTLEKRLGAGGMGEVYQAYDRRLDRRVAIKLIRPEQTENETARERFRREARAAAGLSHPSIVQIHDIVETDESDAIVMELVEGERLSQRIARGPLPVGDAVRIGREIAEGLAAAHAKGLIHRDLKPENVMITPEGKAKILDFGLAKRLEGEASLTEDQRVVGTFRAMSPEQAQGMPLDARSDLFSLGLLLYEMLSGKSPFAGSSTLETLTRICTHQQTPLREVNPAIPAPLSALVDQLLEKEPARRPQSAREAVSWLERSGSAASVGLSEGGPTWNGKHGAGFLETGRELDENRTSRPRLKRRWALVAALVALLALLGVVLEQSARRALAGRRPTAPREDLTAVARETAPVQLYREGMAYLERFDKKGHVDRAVEDFQRALAIDETSAPANAGLARAYWRKFLVDHDPSFLDRSLAAAHQAVTLDGHLAAARVSLGLAEVAHRDYPEAAAELAQARILDPSNADTWRGLADISLAREDFDTAERDYKEAIRRQPRDRELQDLLGALYYRTGRYQQAEASFRRSIELAPDSIFGYRNLSAAYYSEGRYDEAAAQLQKALEIQPLPSLYSNLGTLLFYQGLYPQAVPAFEKALETSGGAHDFRMWANLADAYRWTPDHREKARAAYLQAIQMLRETLSARPGDIALRSRLALYLAKRGDREEALSELAKIGPIGDKDADSLYFAAEAYEIAGRREAALEALGRALRAGYSQESMRRDPELVALRADPRFFRLAK
ncbi:MAG: protein kinase [Thermoanaerobaculia bacterium]